MAAGLFAGVLWESFNAASRAKWIYTVPFLEHVKVFEMPPIGFLGFPFFALEVWSLYHVLAPRTTARTVLSSVLFAGLVLAGVDHWTVSSVSPRLAELPGISDAVRARLQDAGWTDVFRLARAPAAEVAYRARITPDEALAARQAARLSTLRGIGTRHAAARSEEHTSELQSQSNLVCRLLLEKKRQSTRLLRPNLHLVPAFRTRIVCTLPHPFPMCTCLRLGPAQKAM